MDNELELWTQRLREEVATERETALAVGDLLVVIQRSWGRKQMFQSAKEAGLSYGTAKQRYWVSSRLEPGNPLRDYNLSWTHLRTILRLDDAVLRLQIAEQVRTETLSVSALNLMIDNILDVAREPQQTPAAPLLRPVERNTHHLLSRHNVAITPVEGPYISIKFSKDRSDLVLAQGEGDSIVLEILVEDEKSYGTRVKKAAEIMAGIQPTGNANVTLNRETAAQLHDALTLWLER